MPDSTIEYYDRYGGEFAARTRDLDMTALYEPFLKLVPTGGYILDAGCGSGRDSKAFLDRGYEVLSIDASRKMAEIASVFTGQKAHVMRLQDLDFIQEFDGIWACGSLLHIPRAEMCDVFGKLAAALKPGGVMYASLKVGQKDEVREGRLFTNYTEDGIRELAAGIQALLVLNIWAAEDVRPGEERPDWLNVLLRRH